MTMTSLPSHTLLRHIVARRSFNQQQARDAVRATIYSRPSLASSCRSNTSSAAASSQSSSLCRRATTGLLASLAYSAVYTTATTSMALCDDSNDNSDDEDFISKIQSKIEATAKSEAFNSIATLLGSQISTAISSGIPTDISYGFFAGYFSGLALKKVGKVASIALGVSFLALQTLAYHGYIDVHHDKLQKQVEGLLDRNNDGVVDAEDLKSVLGEVKKVAGFGIEDGDDDDEDGNKNLVASGGGFGMGFLGGLRSG